MQFAAIASILSMAVTVNAHMLLNKPQMFPNTGFSTKSNGPLNNHGENPGVASNYPCKASGSGSYDFSFPRTQMPVGSNYSMQLMGDAVHGGGSCQMSLTKDLQPTAKSVFKVIHSVEGGCPARNTPGNLGGSATQMDPFEYTFTIPKEIEPGQYTFAWTWFNLVGNREMYMNCAPIEVTGGAAKRHVHDHVSHPLKARDSSFFDSLPDIYLANIPDVSCTSPAEGPNANIKFPNPGKSVEQNVVDNLLSPPKGVCYAPIGGASGSSSSSDPSGASPAAGSPVASVPAVIPPSAAPSAPIHAAPAPGTPVAIPSAPATPIASDPATMSAVSGTTSGACLSGQMTCTGEDLVCIGESQFGLCNNGCMVPQNVATGTTCANGAILRRRGRSYPPPARRVARAQM